MSTTLQIESFATSNLRERSDLKSDAAVSATSLDVSSTQGFEAGQTIYVGILAHEGCEQAVIDSVLDADTLALVSPLTCAHTRFEPVTAVLGGRIRIYRAPNVDGTPPADGAYSVLATRSIDPDQQTTYYTDSSGSSAYWYRRTYFNETTLEETSLGNSTPVRGDNFAHYATLSDIRRKAGFENATNLSDFVVDQNRRLAEAEINTSLGGSFVVPFAKPIPDQINALTIQLAAGMLLNDAYNGQSTEGTQLLKDARLQLATLRSGDGSLPGDTLSLGSGAISSWPNDSTACTRPEDGGGERMFRVSDRY